MNKSFVFIFTCSVAFFASIAMPLIPARAQLTLDSCYARAVRHYPVSRQYELIAASREYTLGNAGKAWLPQFSVTAIEGYVFGDFRSFGAAESSGDFKFIGLAQVNQTLWDGGATKAQKKIIHASAETEKASLDIALHDLRTRINELYFGILLVDEQLRQLEVQYAVLNNNLGRAKQLSANGLAYTTDVDEIMVELLKLNQQKISFRYTRTGYMTMLSLFIGARLEENTVLHKPMVNRDVTSGSAINRPELSLYASQRELTTAQAGMQRVSLMPKFGLLGAGVMLAPGLSTGSASTIGVAGLNAQWNIGGLYKNKNEKQLAQQSLNKIDIQEETFLFNTQISLTQATANIEKQRAILADDGEIVTLRQRIREGQQVKYNAGAGPLLDLLNAIEKESEARALKATHEMQLLMTQYEYITLTGN